jgi:hypothetical protein
VIDLLLEAGNCKCLNCPVALNALPQVPSVEELAAAGTSGELLLELGGQDLGATPTLYEKPIVPHNPAKRRPREASDTASSPE